jgi:hypothetical protein
MRLLLQITEVVLCAAAVAVYVANSKPQQRLGAVLYRRARARAVLSPSPSGPNTPTNISHHITSHPIGRGLRGAWCVAGNVLLVAIPAARGALCRSAQGQPTAVAASGMGAQVATAAPPRATVHL